MSFEAWISIAVMLGAVAAMVRGVAGPDLVLVGAMTLLMLFGILTPAQAIEGFSNEGMLTVAVLFVVAAGIESTGAMDWVVRRVLGRPDSVLSAQVRMMIPAAGISAFLNNTPVVAMMLPIVQDWAKRIGVSPSKLLMPLSWATILGGTLTIIGTSTNLVVTGMATRRFPDMAWNMFEIAPIGAIVVVIGLVYITLGSRWLLPDRTGKAQLPDNPRDYSVAFQVEGGSPLVGATIEGAGLRHLPGLYLVEIERDGESIAAVSPETRLRAGDVLVFVGVLESVVDLRKFRGLVPAADDQVRKIGGPASGRRLVEAVVAYNSPLAGKTVREAKIRTRYKAAIIAVHRSGERLRGKIGDIELRFGDTLLLETQPTFLDTYRNDRAFALISQVNRSAPVRHDRGWIAALLLLAMIVSNATGYANLLLAGLVCAGAMMATGCLGGPTARRALDLNVLLAIAAAFSVGKALEVTGAAETLGHFIVETTAPFGKLGALAGVYLAVMILTEMVTNNAAAALLFPVAMSAAEAAGIDPKPMCYIVMFAASASFMTPIGYQTNLMVFGPGGYRFGDFIRFGAPMQLLLAATTVMTTYSLFVR
ncbi:MAG: SLC13 family permease [Candidatus Binatia bacterium]